MGYIHCCSGLRKSKSYELSCDSKYLVMELDYLEACPVCGHTVLQLIKIDVDNNVHICRKINKKAKKLLEKIKPSIICEKSDFSKTIKSGSKFYLNYSEFGVKKKCYSNLSTLKIGLFENKKINFNKNILVSSN